MTEITDQEIRDTIFEVLKKQVAEDQIAKEQRRKKRRITTSDLYKKECFITNEVLSETEERLSEGGDIINLKERVQSSFDQLCSEGYFDLGQYEGDPDHREFYLTDKGKEKLKEYM